MAGLTVRRLLRTLAMSPSSRISAGQGARLEGGIRGHGSVEAVARLDVLEKAGVVGFQPRSSCVMVLEAGMSVLRRWTSMPPNSSAGRERAGRFRCRPMASAISRTDTPSSPTALSTAPAGACSMASR